MRDSVWDDLERRIADLLAREGIPGASVAFARGGRLLFARGFGFRDRESAIPADAATIFGVASVTKSFTAVALARLQQEGKLRLDDPVRRYVPEWDVPDPVARESVTLRHLLSHTGGLPPLGVRRGVSMSAPDGPPVLPVPPSLEGILRYLREEPYRILGAPGSIFSYSNEGYAVLGAVVARAAGMPYEEYVLTQIVRPLGMTCTAFDTAELARWDNVTRLYERVDGEIRRVDEWPRWGPYVSSGALRSNVLDLVRYTQLFLAPEEGAVLTRDAVRDLTTPLIEYLPGRYYACGLSVQRWGDFTVISHGGNQRGIAAHLAFVPEARLAAVALLNVGRAPAEEICCWGLRALLGLPEEPDPMEAGTALPRDHAPDEYLGVYRSAEGVTVRVSYTSEQGRLVASLDEQTCPLAFVAPDLAYARLRSRCVPLFFLRGGTGTVWAVRYQLRVLARTPD